MQKMRRYNMTHERTLAFSARRVNYVCRENKASFAVYNESLHQKNKMWNI